MLSKVLNARDALRARSPAFSSVSVGSKCEPEPKPAPDADETARLTNENRQLSERVHRLEGELIATKRDAFEAGRSEGERYARAEIAPVLERVASSLSQLSELRQNLRLEAENDMVQLALLIAKRILHRELSTDSNALTALARVVFDRMLRGESLHVTIHPNFAPALSSVLLQNRATRVHIDPDPQCPLGSFIVRSDEGTLDASVDAQLEEISRGLTDRLTGRT